MMLISSVTTLCYVSCMKVHKHCCTLTVRSHEPNAQAFIQISCQGIPPVPLLEAADNASASSQKIETSDIR